MLMRLFSKPRKFESENWNQIIQWACMISRYLLFRSFFFSYKVWLKLQSVHLTEKNRGIKKYICALRSKKDNESENQHSLPFIVRVYVQKFILGWLISHHLKSILGQIGWGVWKRYWLTRARDWISIIFSWISYEYD